MHKQLIALLLACLFCPLAYADNGLINVKSAHSVSTTVNRLEGILKNKGMKIFARIDLPQKALIWQDESNNVWLTYNAPSHLNTRHSLKGCDKAVAKVIGYSLRSPIKPHLPNRKDFSLYNNRRSVTVLNNLPSSINSRQISTQNIVG